MTHHCNDAIIYGYIGPPEMTESSDGGDAARIQNVPVVVHDLDINTYLPHLE